MIHITAKDFSKLVELLKKDGQDGALLTFRENGVTLEISTVDKQNKEMIIELSDSDYPRLPRVTKTETF